MKRIGPFIAAHLLMLLPALCFAQTQTTGRIIGRVTDSQNASVAGGRITLESIATGKQQTTTTDETGNYAICFLPAGSYKLLIDSPGFASALFNNIRVGMSATTMVNATLKIAQANAELTVTDARPLIQSTSPQLGIAIDEQPLVALPLPTRNFLQLPVLTPGVTAPLTNNSAIGRNSPNFTVNGARDSENNLQINGVPANNMFDHNFAGVAVPAPESIHEVVVQTSMYDASVGEAGGGNIQVATKSGTTQFHGSVYGFFRNEALNANDPNLKKVGVSRPELRRNVYGGTLGGPIRKNRAFFFVSYQGTRERNAATDESIFKDALIAPGLTDDRSESTLLHTFHPVLSDGTAAIAINPISLKLLNAKLPNGQYLIPTPQSEDGRVSGTALSTYHEEQFNSNLDFRLSSKDSVAAKFFLANAPQFNALGGDGFLSAAFGGTTLPGFGLRVEDNNRLLSLSNVHTFGPSAVNETRFGYNGITIRGVPQRPIRDSSLGIQRSTADTFPGLPLILLSRDAGGAAIGSPFVTIDGVSSSWSLAEVLSIDHKGHTLRLGGDFCHFRWHGRGNANTYGEIEFPTFNDFLTGNIDAASIGVGLSQRDFRTSDYGLFVQDDWRLARSLTLNLGLRYEVDVPAYDAQGRIGGFDPALYQPNKELGPDGLPLGPPLGGFVMAGNSRYNVPGVSKVGKRVVDSIDPNNFSPRIGFVWAPQHSGRMIVRGGYGIFYSRPSFFYLALDFFSPPFYANLLSRGQTFANPFPNAPSEREFPLVPIGTSVAATVLDRHMRTPYFQHFNTSVQYEVIRDTVLQIAYVGSRGSKLLRQIAINQARIASLQRPITNAVTGQVITDNTNQNAPLRAPMQGLDSASFYLNQTNGASTYHSLQASLTHRPAHGVQVQASYTFSKAIDDGSVPGLDTSSVLGNQLSPNSNRGLSDADRTHRLVGYFVWDLPKASWGNRLFSDWQLSGIVTVMSGLPIDVFDLAGGSLYGLPGARPNWAPGANRHTANSNVSPGYYFNPSAFAMALVQPGQPIPSANDATALAGDLGTDLGNVGRNVLRGPAQNNVDFSVVKRFPISESKALEFRTDIFNLFNHANRENPVSDISAVLGTGGDIDFKTGRITNPGDFGRILGFSSSPRIMQLGVRFSF